ncbi:MAG: hypothetical protein ACPGTO_10215, partial [Polaribacter sp.]
TYSYKSEETLPKGQECIIFKEKLFYYLPNSFSKIKELKERSIIKEEENNPILTIERFVNCQNKILIILDRAHNISRAKLGDARSQFDKSYNPFKQS